MDALEGGARHVLAEGEEFTLQVQRIRRAKVDIIQVAVQDNEGNKVVIHMDRAQWELFIRTEAKMLHKGA